MDVHALEGVCNFSLPYTSTDTNTDSLWLAQDKDEEDSRSAGAAALHSHLLISTTQQGTRNAIEHQWGEAMLTW